MNRKFGLPATIVLAVGLAGPALAHDTEDESKTGQERKAPQTKEGAQGAQRTKAEMDSVRLSSLEKEQVKTVQNKLKDLGLFKDEADGKLGASTRAALSRYFNTQLMLLKQNRLSNTSLSAFGFDQNEVQRVRGVDEKRAPERQPTKGSDESQPKAPKEQEQPKQK